MAGGFLSLVHFFLCPGKEMNFPQWNPLEKEKHRWNDKGIIYEMRDNVEKPGRRLRPFKTSPSHFPNQKSPPISGGDPLTANS